MEYSTRDVARFWSNCRTTISGCWPWCGAKDANGYGNAYIQGDPAPAHRVAWEIANQQEIPNGLYIDHICHNPSCVNPDHLRPATPKQNNENHSGAQRNSKSGVRGVFYDARINKWRAQVSHHRQRISLGVFEHMEEAEGVVIAKRNELFTFNNIDR